MDNFLDFNQADLENFNRYSMYLYQYIKAIHYVIEIEFKTHFDERNIYWNKNLLSILIQSLTKNDVYNMEGECPRHGILCQTVQNKTAASNN